MEDISVHPLLAKVHDMGMANVTSFRGYVGPGSTEETIRLYSSLTDLSRSVQIAKADILHVEKIPKSRLPFNAVTIWVKRDAQVTAYRIETTTASVKQEKDFTEINQGRLRIRVRRGSDIGVCYSECFCYSECDCMSV